MIFQINSSKTLEMYLVQYITRKLMYNFSDISMNSFLTAKKGIPNSMMDDAAVITDQNYENQNLLKRFSDWCQYSDTVIRVKKCSTFGFMKTITKSVQYLYPCIRIFYTAKNHRFPILRKRNWGMSNKIFLQLF